MVDTPRAHEQQLPLQNERRSVQDELIGDIIKRRDVGIDTYGTALQPFNGRDPGRDLIEELLDAAVYAKQLAIENRDMKSALSEIVGSLATWESNSTSGGWLVSVPRGFTREILERRGVIL